MLIALAFAALPQQQDTIVDAPLFDERAWGVAIPRPFDDWIFVAGSDRGTTTVFFQPRAGALSDHLWGVLVLTSLDRAEPPAALAERRLVTWRAQFGPSFELRERASTTLLGLPAVRLHMRGSLERAVVEIEEWLVVRGTDLVSLQFRTPRGVAADSIAAGYRRVLEGLWIRGAPDPAPTDAGDASTRWLALRESPWTVERVDVALRAESPGGPRRVAVRLDLVNDGTVPADEIAFWVPPGFVLDSATAGGRPLGVAGRGRAHRVTLAMAVPAAAPVTLSLFYRGPPTLTGWLPEVQPLTDSAGHPRRIGARQVTVRFDLPDSLRGLSTGRLLAQAEIGGRRRMTWHSANAPDPPAVIAALHPITLRPDGRLAVTVWSPAGSPADSAHAAQVAGASTAAWAAWWRAFGPIPRTEIHLVATADSVTRGLDGLVLLGADARAAGVLPSAVARTWWDGAFRVEGEGARVVVDGLVAWAGARFAGVAPPADRATEAFRAATDQLEPARLREILRTLAAEARAGWLTTDDILTALGPRAAAALRAAW